jgi:hypothetical protein
MRPPARRRHGALRHPQLTLLSVPCARATHLRLSPCRQTFADAGAIGAVGLTLSICDVSDLADATQETSNLAFAALDHGIDSIKGGGSLVTFTFTETTEAGRVLTRFAASTFEESLSAARQFLSMSGAVRAAVAYDGYVTVKGERSDAVVVEVYETGTPESFVLGQRYRPKRAFKKFETIGNPAAMGTCPPLF